MRQFIYTMSKIIIKNETELSDAEALWLVLSVVKGGRVSKTVRGEQYCFVSTTKKYVILADRTKSGSDVFTIAHRTKVLA